ncbi:hypothetical protein [Draconibacterium halophilum]|uniref:AhpC/TSA family protein n=1 Tax=Draconibacterium halophilum TaxID=2706887 RepID=A0A6C0R9Y9_9BACT|nr:hypothetical protein [Draconibacterium halophilum]QIA06555.1 hypothetical protein G0Q07_01890 [Draconibacterium halophilum]
MTKNKTALFCLAIFLLMAAGIVSYIIISTKKEQNTCQQIIEPTDIELLNLSLRDDYSPIDDIQIYLGNDATNIKKLYDIIDKPSIVYRFSGRACNICIDFVFKELVKIFPDFDQNNNIIVLCNDTNPRIKESYFGKQLYSVKDSSFNLVIEHFEIPFIFILDNEQRCKHLFIPDYAFPERTDTYLETIKQKYF